jgi:outer membrane protein assembly factor BamB
VITFILCGVMLAVCLLLVQRWMLRRRRVWTVPIAVTASLAVLAILFRWDGFSGEMMPQIRYRFERQPALETSIVDGAAVGDSPTDDLPAIATAAADWPQFLGPNRDGVIATRRFAIPDSVEQVETLWEIGIGEGWSSFAVAGGRAVTLEQRGQQECLTCYRLADGQLLWVRQHDARHENPLGGVGPRSTPTIAGQTVFALGATGHLWCVSLETGSVVWELDLLEIAGWDQLESEVAIPWGRSCSPLVVDGRCIVAFGTPVDAGPEGRSLIALDAETGEVLWTAGEDQISYASPMLMELVGKRQIVSVNEKTVSGHDVASGRTLWTHDWSGRSNASANCAAAIPAGEDRILLGKGYGGGSMLVQIDRETKGEDERFSAASVWTSSRVLKTKFSHACVVGDIALAVSNGMLEAVSIDQPRRRWTQPRRNRVGAGQIVVAGDVIIVQNESGDVVIAKVSADRFDPIIQLDALDAKTWNIPTIAGRHLLVRNDRRAICYLLPARTSSHDRP